jgi:hypothetical protein
MNHRINPRNLAQCIERLAKKGYTIDVEHCEKHIRISFEAHELRNMIPFGQTRLNEFGG